MPPNKNHPSVAVVGGGISGLTTAFLLKKRGVDVTVFEKNSYPGGVIRSVNRRGWLVEWGPNTLMAKSDQLWDLLEQLELTEHIVRTGKEGSKRYIVKEGKPEPLPTSLVEFIRSPLISAKAKFRLFKEPFISKSDQTESIADFFERRLGREVLDYAVNPFVAGIYAGDPKNLSVQHTLSKVYELEQEYGSIVKGAVKSAGDSRSKSKHRKKGLISFQKGIQQLPAQLQQQLGNAVQFNSTVTQVQSRDHSWRVEINEEKHHQFDVLIYTAPLHQLSSMGIEIKKEALLDHLGTLRYAPIATLALGFEQNQILHPVDGFGMLVPEAEPFNILGCLFSSSLFEGRAPGGHALLTCFVGGDRNPGHVDLPDEELKTMAMNDLRELLGCSGEPVFELLHRWKRAIPQYGLDHQSRLDAMNELEETNPGFYFTGNFREEVSVPGCIGKAYETADRAASFLQS